MFDTMTVTKAVAGVCGALLILLLGNWGASALYAVGGGGHGKGHGDGEHHAAYIIEVAEEGGAGAAVEEGPSFEELLAAADAGKGEKVFGKCKSCHKLEDGANSTGPHLYALVGRNVGAVDGFGYSGKLSEAADVWTYENLDAFLTSPKKFAPGTSMGFAGLKKAEDRANLIAYLETIGN